MEKGLQQDTRRRQIVAYFDHEFMPPSQQKLDRDIQEMLDAGFTHVVLCVTESDLLSAERQAYLKDVVAQMKACGIEVWADPWAVGGVFGGEGKSWFRERGELRCDCNPALKTLLADQWLPTVKELGVETVFWDEPEMHHAPHRNDELAFIDKYTRIAGALALRNVVCLTANRAKRGQLDIVAGMSQVAEIASDPYYQNAFEVISEENRLAYVAENTLATLEAAARHGKRAHVWVQNFGIPEGREYMIDEHLAVVTGLGADVAVWGFRGCESVPNFVRPGEASSAAMWDRTLHFGMLSAAQKLIMWHTLQARAGQPSILKP